MRMLKGELCISQCLLEGTLMPFPSLWFYISITTYSDKVVFVSRNSQNLGWDTPESIFANPLVACSFPVPPTSSYVQSPVILSGLIGGGEVPDSQVSCPFCMAISPFQFTFLFLSFPSKSFPSIIQSINIYWAPQCTLQCSGLYRIQNLKTPWSLPSRVPIFLPEGPNCHMFSN